MKMSSVEIVGNGRQVLKITNKGRTCRDMGGVNTFTNKTYRQKRKRECVQIVEGDRHEDFSLNKTRN